MVTISVPLPKELDEFVEKMVKNNRGENKASVVRFALKRFQEEEAVNAVLRAQGEPSLRGDIKDLIKKL